MRVRRIVFVGVLVVLVAGFPYLMISGPSTGEAAGTTAKAVVMAMVLNTSHQVIHDYVGQMNLAAIVALADAHPSDAIPQGDLLPQLPGPVTGWNWMLPGGQYSSNGTYATASGIYILGEMTAMQAMAQVAIHHNVGGFQYSSEPDTPDYVFEFDEGYPKETTIQGYTAVEWRASGDKLGEVTGVPGEVESMSGLWIGLGMGAPIPEGWLILAAPLVLLGWRARRAR